MMLNVSVWGVDLYILLLIASGIFYLIGAMLIWKPLKQERNELIGALFAFLMYQFFAMVFMGIEMWTHNIVFGYAAAFAIFVGSAYMLKFPFARFSSGVRKSVFWLAMVISLAILVYFILSTNPDKQMALMNFVIMYDIIINGIIVGGSIILFAIATIESAKRKKAVAGGAGVLSCCVVANATMLTGALVTSVIFQFLAPILILFAIKSKKFNPSQMMSSSTPNLSPNNQYNSNPTV